MSHHITPQLGKNPQRSPQFPVSPDPNDVAAVLADLDAVPRSELPDGAARAMLAEAIRTGAVDGIYRPFGAVAHNLTLAWLPRDRDPRRRVGDFLELWHVSCLFGSPALIMAWLDGENLMDLCQRQIEQLHVTEHDVPDAGDLEVR